MTTKRRIGTEDSTTRNALLDAALQLMVEEGYAAVTSRRVAARAGLKPQLVHYYFRTMDDLFIALVRRGAEQNLVRQSRALASPQPLRALWELSCDPTGATLTLEFSALANHRKAKAAPVSSRGGHPPQAAPSTAAMREVANAATTAIEHRPELARDPAGTVAPSVLFEQCERIRRAAMKAGVENRAEVLEILTTTAGEIERYVP